MLSVVIFCSIRAIVERFVGGRGAPLLEGGANAVHFVLELEGTSLSGHHGGFSRYDSVIPRARMRLGLQYLVVVVLEQADVRDRDDETSRLQKAKDASQIRFSHNIIILGASWLRILALTIKQKKQGRYLTPTQNIHVNTTFLATERDGSHDSVSDPNCCQRKRCGRRPVRQYYQDGPCIWVRPTLL